MGATGYTVYRMDRALRADRQIWAAFKNNPHHKGACSQLGR